MNEKITDILVEILVFILAPLIVFAEVMGVLPQLPQPLHQSILHISIFINNIFDLFGIAESLQSDIQGTYYWILNFYGVQNDWMFTYWNILFFGLVVYFIYKLRRLMAPLYRDLEDEAKQKLRQRELGQGSVSGVLPFFAGIPLIIITFIILVISTILTCILFKKYPAIVDAPNIVTVFAGVFGVTTTIIGILRYNHDINNEEKIIWNIMNNLLQNKKLELVSKIDQELKIRYMIQRSDLEDSISRRDKVKIQEGEKLKALLQSANASANIKELVELCNKAEVWLQYP